MVGKKPNVKLEEIVKIAKAEALVALKGMGIDDEDGITVKLKAMKGPKDQHWIGLYRSMSQFRGGAIFWINSDIQKVVEEEGLDPGKTKDVIRDTILHEYGHVIWEYASKRAPALMENIQAIDDDEEEWAESFALAANKPAYSGAYKRLAQEFVKAVDEELRRGH